MTTLVPWFDFGVNYLQSSKSKSGTVCGAGAVNGVEAAGGAEAADGVEAASGEWLRAEAAELSD